MKCVCCFALFLVESPFLLVSFVLNKTLHLIHLLFKGLSMLFGVIFVSLVCSLAYVWNGKREVLDFLNRLKKRAEEKAKEENDL